jgi:hypothetical protein
MLCGLDNDTNLKVVWHKKFFDACKNRLSNDEYQIMIDKLNSIVQNSIDNKSDIVVSSFIPGSDWSDTVWESIYTKACGHDEEHSAQFFGLLVCQVLINRDEKWYFLKQDIARGMIYFKGKEKNKLDALQEKFGE